jgi:nitroreductase/dihydropteridine reductase
MNLNDSLRWRYATKKFDPTRKLSAEVVDSILESGNLTATSYGLQPYQLVLLQDPELQQQLVASSYSQRQVADASHVIIIAIRTDIDEVYIRQYLTMKEQQQNLAGGSLQDYGDSMVKTIMGMSDAQRLDWAARQAYLVMGTLLVACAVHQVDACPMEGFVPREYNEKLDLSARNLHAQLVLPLGYRSAEDGNQSLSKVRRPLDQMVVRLGVVE